MNLILFVSFQSAKIFVDFPKIVVDIMNVPYKYVKILPIEPNISRRCGVCDELLVIPPIYSCKSVSFICGPCFEGYRYYLDDDDLRANDRPIRQILYENFASRVSFPCSYYPHCRGEMSFDYGAKLHYKEYCFAKVLWIFKCPISRANRWFLRPDQDYCFWRYKRNNLLEDENEKLSKHLRHLHGEYVLERPYILQLRDLKNYAQPRRIFLLLLEENDLIAALLTEITMADIIFRCRVNDSVDKTTATNDPYECCISLVPPNERFSSLVDVKFECIPFDSNDVEYPWQSLRLPLRHLIEETSFKICVLPRSIMVRSIPYLHRDRQLLSNAGVEDAMSEGTLTASENGMLTSEGTMSIADSNKTDIELFSYPSSNSEDRSVGFTRNPIELWEIEEFEEIPQESPTKNVEECQVSGIDLLVDAIYVSEHTEETEKTSVNRNLFSAPNDDAQCSSSDLLIPQLSPLTSSAEVTEPAAIDPNLPWIPTTIADLPQLMECVSLEERASVRNDLSISTSPAAQNSSSQSPRELVNTPKYENKETCMNISPESNSDCERNEFTPSSYEGPQTEPQEYKSMNVKKNQAPNIADVRECIPPSLNHPLSPAPILIPLEHSQRVSRNDSGVSEYSSSKTSIPDDPTQLNSSGQPEGRMNTDMKTEILSENDAIKKVSQNEIAYITFDDKRELEEILAKISLSEKVKSPIKVNENDYSNGFHERFLFDMNEDDEELEETDRHYIRETDLIPAVTVTERGSMGSMFECSEKNFEN
ncbi:uncharacterized protein LOC123321397 [Coccinella septempunctata]|uniref:uncharacterized protein LOC123321397 n=1 Tax=Coccinella septempunctata TaxID=41139 RepID=UPI001D083E80|nr:uncharacterized protein LOC123321397 [Coccinella septempunctata]